MSVATTDAFRNIAVVQPSYPEDVVTTVAAEQVGDTLTITAGFGITITADPTSDSIIINNTGNGTGAYTEITDSNADATYYPLFSRPFAPEDINSEDIPPSYQLDTIYVDNTTTPMTYNPSTGALTAVSFVGSLTGNADTVTNGVYTSSSFNLGTTSIAINRASASQSLTGISIDGNAGTVTNGVYTTSSYSDPSWLTISATKVGLGNVTNESKATMFTSPTFTGTVSGVTATHVGLGNVTNESKATMFTSPTFTGHPTIEGVTSTGATGTGNLVFSTAPTFTGTTSIATLSLTNPLAITSGGTGATSAGSALTNLLPAGAVSGYVLKTSGPGSFYWAAETGASTVVGTTITTSRTEYTATASQQLFTGTGTYTIGAGQLRVYIDGARQFPTAYTETSTTSFTLSAGVPAGTKVLAEVDGYTNNTVTANAVTFSPVGAIAATDVQAAIAELDTEKAALSGATFTGTVTFKQTIEQFTSPSISANAVTLDFTTGAIYSLGSNAANITANFTNIPGTAGQVISTTLIITQGGTAYYPSAVTINGGGSITPKWQGGSAPSGTASHVNIVSFTFVCTATNTWTVIGSLTDYN